MCAAKTKRRDMTPEPAPLWMQERPQLKAHNVYWLRKRCRQILYDLHVHGSKTRQITCYACSGSGYYDNTGSPKCGGCWGRGRSTEPTVELALVHSHPRLALELVAELKRLCDQEHIALIRALGTTYFVSKVIERVTVTAHKVIQERG